MPSKIDAMTVEYSSLPREKIGYTVSNFMYGEQNLTERDDDFEHRMSLLILHLIRMNNRYPKIVIITHHGVIKALTGEFGGATCTSSNVKKIFEWALKQNKKIL